MNICSEGRNVIAQTQLTNRIASVETERLDEQSFRIALTSRIAPSVLSHGIQYVAQYTIYVDGRIDVITHITPQDFEQARHTYELQPRETITLHIDHRHHGLGSNSCGPGPLPQYELHPEEFRFAFQLVPVL